MTNRTHEIEYLFTVLGLELFVRNMQDKITALQNEWFYPLPQEPRLMGNTSVGKKPEMPAAAKTQAFSFAGALDSIGIVGFFVVIAVTILEILLASNLFVLDWRNPFLLILALTAGFLCGYLVIELVVAFVNSL